MPAMLPFSLDALRSHAIFVAPAGSSASGSSDDDWELVDASNTEGLPATKSQRIAVRDKDLLVAFGKEIRMTSLAGEGWEVHGATVGGYKTLKSPHLTFDIKKLVVNPTGRLLAVVGYHQLVILVLPRAGFASSVGGDVPCRCFPVDEYQHSPSSSNTISKVKWHSWGESGNSLWVLTADGKLFEYDVLRPQDPVQTFRFLPEKGSKPKSKFSAVDPLSEYATSFTFSIGSMDFAPLMVYALMANGDIYTMGPVLPLHAEVPVEYLQALQAWTTARLRRLQDRKDGDATTAEHAALVGRATLHGQWVDALVHQADTGEEEASFAASTSSPRRGYGLRDSIRQSTPTPAAPPSPGRSPAPPGLVRVHPPHLTASGGPAPGRHRALMRQGPLRFDPAPQEVGNGDDIDEQCATDIALLRGGDDVAEADRVNILAIAWSGGRVDLGVEEIAPEPRWVTSRDPAPADVVLPIVESVLVSFPESVDEEAIACNAPAFVSDPIHSDVVYVQHSFGVDAVSTAPWAAKVFDGAELKPSDVACLIEGSTARPIVGSVTFCNITLGYGLLALANTGQLASVEMDFRVPDNEMAPPPVADKPAPNPASKDERSLLTKPFDSAALVARVTAASQDPRAPVRALADGRKPLETISPSHLRALGEASTRVRTRAEALRSASHAAEGRVDLLVAESERQLKLLHEAAIAVRTVKDKSKANTERAEKLVDAQGALGSRLDTVLASLLAEYRPQIGHAERKWFDELERIRGRVAGTRGRNTTVGFAHKSQVLKEQLGVVRPLAERAQRDAAEEAGLVGVSGVDAPGARQLRPLQEALASRGEELARLMRKMESLSMRVEGTEAEEQQ